VIKERHVPKKSTELRGEQHKSFRGVQ
jgi:hypothetical protein